MLPPNKSQLHVPPDEGWAEHTVYVVDVSHRPDNPVHRALLFVGFTTNHGSPVSKGKPSSYSEVWTNSYDRSYKMHEVFYIRVIRKLGRIDD